MKLRLLLPLFIVMAFTLNAQLLIENVINSSILPKVTSQNSYSGSYYDNLNPNSTSFIYDLKNRIRFPYAHIPYSQYDETIVANYESLDNGDGTRSLFCVYSNDEFRYTNFSWVPSGTFSREHTFPHSWMPTNPANGSSTTIEREEYADQHHLFPTNHNSANVVRSNNPLGIVDNIASTFGQAKSGQDINGNTVYEPRDEHKGDAARAILYMILRYDGIDGYDWGINATNNTIVNVRNRDPQDLELLLQWHTQDPPNQWEIGRNDYIQSIQGNRNPFVDHPEYVDYIDFYKVEYKSKEIYFSEYVEGSSNNKALEVFNNTAYNIDLATSNYKIKIYNNGSSTPTTTINLSGNIADNNTFVIGNSLADASILSVSNQTTSSLNYDGNDAIVLLKGTEIVDVIGQIGFNPGSEWGTGVTSTMNNTLRRKLSIGYGDSDGSDLFDPITEWDGYANNIFNGLGNYEINKESPIISTVARTIKIPTESENTVVGAEVIDDGSVEIVKIKFTIDGGNEQEVSMSNISGSSYQGTIPSSVYINGSFLEYRISATDEFGATTFSKQQKIFIGTTPISKLHSINADGWLDYLNIYARISGVATVTNGTFSSSHLDVNIQDGDGALTVFKLGGSSTTILEGNTYTVEGKLAQYKGKTEIIPDNINANIIDEGVGSLPEPLVLSITELLQNPETYEGMLIKILQVTKTSGTWPFATHSASLEISDGGGANTLTLRIDSDTNIDENSEPNWPKDVVGIFTQYSTYTPYTWGYQIQPRNIADFSNSITIQLKIFLEGAYNIGTTEMFNNLNNSIPLQSPYSEDSRKIISMPTNIVDWILIQLRTTETGEVVSSHSALLHKDGRIVADDGTSNTIRITAEPNEEYYIVIKHRNHLPIMSKMKVNLNIN